MSEPLVGSGEVAEMLGVYPETVSRWRRRGEIIEADEELKSGPVWLRARIETWARETGRWPDDGTDQA